MRTIKFRGYNPKNNKWIYGYYLVNRGLHFIVEDGIAPPQNTWEDYEVEPETIGQYTGKNDKNGTEIYEGDIVKRLDIKVGGAIVWREEQSAFRCAFGNYVFFIVCEDFEVIGNIYDK